MTKLAFVFGFAVGQASLPNCAVGHEGAGRDSRRCGESGGCGRRVGKGEAEAAGEISDLMSSLNGRKKCEHDPRKNTVLARTAGAPPSASTTERGASPLHLQAQQREEQVLLSRLCLQMEAPDAGANAWTVYASRRHWSARTRKRRTSRTPPVVPNRRTTTYLIWARPRT